MMNTNTYAGASVWNSSNMNLDLPLVWEIFLKHVWQQRLLLVNSKFKISFYLCLINLFLLIYCCSIKLYSQFMQEPVKPEGSHTFSLNCIVHVFQISYMETDTIATLLIDHRPLMSLKWFLLHLQHLCKSPIPEQLSHVPVSVFVCERTFHLTGGRSLIGYLLTGNMLPVWELDRNPSRCFLLIFPFDIWSFRPRYVNDG